MLLDLHYFRSTLCRDHIIAAAHQALRQGNGCISIEQVAAAAELPRSVVLLHFPGLQGLCDVILEEFFHDVLPGAVGSTFDRLIRSRHHLTELDLLRLFLDILRLMLEEYPHYFKADFYSSQQRRQLNGWSFFQIFLDRYLGLVDTHFNRGRDAGIFSEDLTPDAVRQFLRGLFLGSTMQCLFIEEACDPSFLFEKVKEQTQQLLCAGRYDWKMMTD
jgi:AcrR family transcriptional regulator